MENEKFIVVCWPESQRLMEKEGFDENAYSINDESGLSKFGGFAYFVAENWYNLNN